MFGMSDDDVRLCFLPLSHIFARTCDLYTWIAAGNVLCLATSRDSVLADCQWAHPTIMSGVPYFFDRVYRAVARTRGWTQSPDGLRHLLGGQIQILWQRRRRAFPIICLTFTPSKMCRCCKATD